MGAGCASLVRGVGVSLAIAPVRNGSEDSFIFYMTGDHGK